MEVVSIYTDGGMIASNPSEFGGTWAWVAVNQQHERVYGEYGMIPASAMSRLGVSPMVTNNQTEFYAVLKALEALPDGWSGLVCSDSMVTLNRFLPCKDGGMSGRGFGWKMENIPQDWVRRGQRARGRLGKLVPVLLAGHPSALDLACGYRHDKEPHRLLPRSVCEQSPKRPWHAWPVSEHNVEVNALCAQAAEEFRESLDEATRRLTYQSYIQLQSRLLRTLAK